MTTEAEYLDAFRRGERIKPEHSIHDAETACTYPCGEQRPIVCSGDRDVVECSKCGKQRETSCNFDDDYS